MPHNLDLCISGRHITEQNEIYRAPPDEDYLEFRESLYDPVKNNMFPRLYQTKDKLSTDLRVVNVSAKRVEFDEEKLQWQTMTKKMHKRALQTRRCKLGIFTKEDLKEDLKRDLHRQLP